MMSLMLWMLAYKLIKLDLYEIALFILIVHAFATLQQRYW